MLHYGNKAYRSLCYIINDDVSLFVTFLRHNCSTNRRVDLYIVYLNPNIINVRSRSVI